MNPIAAADTTSIAVLPLRLLISIVKRHLALWIGLGLSVAGAVGADVTAPFVAGLARRPALPEAAAGAVLLTELGCTACHAPPGQSPALRPKPGPDLSEIGSRVAAGHLRRFVAEPTLTNPGTTMPDVLRHLPGPERDAVATAITHYLATLGDGRFTDSAPTPEAVDRGRSLYHSVGCVACHAPEESSPPDSIPLGPLPEKYSVSSLTRFLEDPLSIRPGARMPDLKLDHFEAEAIASYLLRGRTGVPRVVEPAPDVQLLGRGREEFVKHRCGACHEIGNRESPVGSLPLNQLRPDRGCLSRETGPWPAYDLSETQRDAIRSALRASEGPLDAEGEVLVDLTVTRLNCLACHTLGERGGVPPERDAFFTGRDENLGDQGRLPPPLTGVGAKLRPKSLRDVLVNGSGVRPYLHTRMPRFGAANTEFLVDALRRIEPPIPPPSLDGELSARPHEIGRELAGSKGFNCVSCHTFRGQSAAAIRGLDLMTMAERLEEGWFHRYLANPQRFSPLTIMPEFWPGKVSPLSDVLGGDPDRQRDALWKFLARGPEAGEPRGLILEPLVVAVADEAVILRRAFPGIGKRGIGVGYPKGIHLAFDAERMRLGSVWSGGFIEASALWRGQGAGQARPLGRDVVQFPVGPAFAVLPSSDAPWPTNTIERPDGHAFRGYSLDSVRRPTFRYQLGPLRVEDQFLDRANPAGKVYLERTLGFPSGPPPPGWHFRVAADPRMERRAANTYAVGGNLVVVLPNAGIVRDVAGVRELLLPVTGAFTVEYHLASPP
ncbi:MAG: hypothetical protein AB7O66_16855 [Limisphaerales bacterium]